MTRFPSWPSSNQGNIVGSRLANMISKRFVGLMSGLSLPDQRDASLAELLSTTGDVFNVKSFGAIGDGVADDAVAIGLAITAAAGATVLFTSGTYDTTGNITVPAGVTARFEQGAILNVDATSTITFTGLVEAGRHQVFDDSAGGSFVFSTTREVYAGWWQNWTTDAGIAWSSAIASIATVGGKVKLPAGDAVLITPVDMTDLTSDFYDIEGVNNSTRITVTNTTMGVDCTGSNHITFRDFTLGGSSVTTPKVGFFFARQASGGNGLFQYMYNVITTGNFTKAGIYKYATEECRFFNCYLQNSADAAACLWMTNDNDGTGEDVTSVYTTTATGNQSNSDNQYFGCTFLEQGDGDADNIRLRGVLNAHWFGSFFAAIGSSPRSHIYIDNDGEETSFISFNGFRGETGGTVRYGIFVDGTTTCQNWVFRNGSFDPVTASIFDNSNGKVQELTWENMGEVSASTNNFDMYNLDNAFIHEPGEFNVRGTLASSTVWCTKSTATIGTNSLSTIHYEDEGSVNPAYGLFHDRGDPSSVDFATGDLTQDAAWNDLDLSSIVPAGAKSVLLSVVVTDGTVDARVQFRKDGNSQALSTSVANTQVVNIPNFVNIIVACSTARVIEYKAAAVAFVALDVTVKGWWY